MPQLFLENHISFKMYNCTKIHVNYFVSMICKKGSTILSPKEETQSSKFFLNGSIIYYYLSITFYIILIIVLISISVDEPLKTMFRIRAESQECPIKGNTYLFSKFRFFLCVGWLLVKLLFIHQMLLIKKKIFDYIISGLARVFKFNILDYKDINQNTFYTLSLAKPWYQLNLGET